MVQCNTDEASGGKYVDRACSAHLQVLDYDVTENDKGVSVKLFFTVLAATDPSQVGKELSDFFPCSGGAVGKFLNVAEATGLITPEQKASSLANKTPLNIDETQFKGRQLCAIIAMEVKRVQDAAGKWIEEPGGKAYPKVNFDTFSVFDAKAKDIPKDPQYIAMLQAGAVTSAPVQQQAASVADTDLDMEF